MRFSIFILNLPKNNVGGAINLSIKSKRPKKNDMYVESNK